MAQIEINCIGQTAIYTNTPEIFSGDVNIDTVKFTFDEAWNGYDMKTAVFYNNPKDTYPVMLDENDVAVIPEAVMADKCKLSIGVFGTNANGDVKTSKILTYNIGKGAISNDLEATTPPEFWTQLLTRQINFENNIDSKVDELDSIARVATKALAYNSYSEMITALNGMGSDELNRGQNIYIGALGVPDLWVYGVEESNVEYTYVDDDTFVESLNRDVTVQVGYFKLAQLETQKVDVGGINSAIENLENDVEILKSDIENLENRGSGLAPYPVTGVTTDYLRFIEGTETARLVVNWTKPIVYDIQVDHYNVYGYVGDTAPTKISDFTLITSISYDKTSCGIDVTEPYNYVLIASVSADGIIQENLSQMSTVEVRYLPARGITLADASWEEINTISEVGLASTYFSVGDTKTVSIDGTNYKVAIYDFNHDNLTSGKKAGITFGLSNCLTTYQQMHTSAKNSVGWSGCSLRSTLRNTILPQLPADLQSVIKTVHKKTTAGGGNATTLSTTTDNVFLFAEVEVLGTFTHSVEGEGTRYPIFTDANSCIKKKGDSGSAQSWHLRSPDNEYTDQFGAIYTSGGYYNNSNRSATDYMYVCFGFCV